MKNEREEDESTLYWTFYYYWLLYRYQRAWVRLFFAHLEDGDEG
jgi:hypothetical protein